MLVTSCCADVFQFHPVAFQSAPSDSVRVCTCLSGEHCQLYKGGLKTNLLLRFVFEIFAFCRLLFSFLFFLLFLLLSFFISFSFHAKWARNIITVSLTPQILFSHWSQTWKTAQGTGRVGRMWFSLTRSSSWTSLKLQREWLLGNLIPGTSRKWPLWLKPSCPRAALGSALRWGCTLHEEWYPCEGKVPPSKPALPPSGRSCQEKQSLIFPFLLSMNHLCGLPVGLSCDCSDFTLEEEL